MRSAIGDGIALACHVRPAAPRTSAVQALKDHSIPIAPHAAKPVLQRYSLVMSPNARRIARVAGILIAMLALVTVAVAGLESSGVDDASELYLLAVVATGVWAGARAAVVCAIGAFLVYDLAFVEPRLTLWVSDPQEWLNLVLLLVVGLVVGRLAGVERDRAETALSREREALAMFRISFALASAPRAPAALADLITVIEEVVPADRIWIEIDDRVRAGSRSGSLPSTAVQNVLTRRPDDQPASWTRVHAPGAGPERDQGASTRDPARTALERYRVVIAAGGRALGSLWLARERAMGAPSPAETRVLSAAADQVGRAVERDRLADDAATAEVARRSDALKSALLDSVSHDLRTPLASIRAASGTLMDPDITWSDEDRRAVAATIDVEADRMNRLVSDLLDMSRIEAGALRPTTAAHVLGDLVEGAVQRSMLERQGQSVSVAIGSGVPPVEVDAVLFGQVLANLLDNAGHYAGPGAQVAITAYRARTYPEGLDRVMLTIEDDGPGVTDDAMPHLFEKFYRAPRSVEGSRRGTGAGLAVVHGLMTAMGGVAVARRSALGGLAIDLLVPVAAAPRSRTSSADEA